MAPSLDAADTMCDALNSHVDLNRDQWKFLASAVFAVMEDAQEEARSERQHAAGAPHPTPCNADEPW